MSKAKEMFYEMRLREQEENQEENQMSEAMSEKLQNSFEYTFSSINGEKKRYLLEKEGEQTVIFGKYTYDCLNQDSIDIFGGYYEDLDISTFDRHRIIKKID